MSEGNVEVRTVARADRDGLFEMAAGFVGGVTRVGLSLAEVPLVLLPRESRRRARRGIAEVARAIVALPREIGMVGERVVDDMFTGSSDFKLPSVGSITDQARNFTERLSRASEEFSASMTRAADRAGKNVEQTAAKVDEWVEKK